MDNLFWGIVVLLSVGWLGICYVVAHTHIDKKNDEDEDD